MSEYIAWLDVAQPLSANVVGGKGASLARLAAAGFPVPPAFAVTAEAYRKYHDHHGLAAFAEALETLSGRPPLAAVREAVAPVVAVVERSALPGDVFSAISGAYAELASRCHSSSTFAVRSSGASEDGATASFAGLYESYINITGHEAIAKAVLDCYACLWQPRAVHYRTIKGLGHRHEAMAAVVMQTVQSRVSGVAFTQHPVTGATDEILINSSWGLGEAIVSGLVTPDNFVVKKTGTVTVRDIARKEKRVVPVPGGTVEEDVPAGDQFACSLTDEQLDTLSRAAVAIEQHYGMPMDIEFAFDVEGAFYLLQARPITTR